MLCTRNPNAVNEWFKVLRLYIPVCGKFKVLMKKLLKRPQSERTAAPATALELDSFSLITVHVKTTIAKRSKQL
jgi:hypothetical protein